MPAQSERRSFPLTGGIQTQTSIEKVEIMKKYVVTVGMTVVISAGGLLAWYDSGAQAAAPQAQAPASAIPVVAEKVQVSDVPIVKTGIGTVEAYNVVNVTAQVAGTIENIGFVEGQTVHPGSVIAQIDPRPYQAALQQAQANLARDQAHLANAQANLQRYTPLAKQGFASAQQLSDQASAVSQLEAAIISDKATIFNAQTQLSYTSINSPIDGVTGIRRVDVGNLVQPTIANPIVTITQIQPISVVFTLPQKDVATVQAAMAKGTLTTIAYGQDDRDKLGEGTLLLVDNTINTSSGTVQLKATFPNENRALWPGEFVSVRLAVAQQHNGISVPLSALQQGQSGMSVYIVQQDGTVRQRPVTVAETLDGRALISQGLTAGDTVVTAGQYRLSDGAKVSQVPAGDPQVQDSSEASAGML
jgi:membrane fusion protein, multidrug efflux system